MAIKDNFILLFPYILVCWLIFFLGKYFGVVKYRQTWYKYLILFIAGVISFIPFDNVSLSGYLLSLNPNFSIGSYALLIAVLYPYLFDKNLLSERDLIVFNFWNLAFSLVLYASYFNFLPYDLYAAGYHFSWGYIPLAFLTLLSIWTNSPLSLIFLAYIAAFDARLLPSPNFFDYVTDGFLFFASLLFLGVALLKNLRVRKARTPAGRTS